MTLKLYKSLKIKNIHIKRKNVKLGMIGEEKCF